MIHRASNNIHDGKTTIDSQEPRYLGPIGAIFIGAGIFAEFTAVVSHRGSDSLDWFTWVLLLVGLFFGGAGLLFIHWAYEAATLEGDK